MSKILESLIEEYNQLKEKLDKVAELIKVYGGSIQDNRVGNIVSIESDDITIASNIYPLNGSWKDKILFILKRHRVNGVMSARQITSEIINQEKIFFESLKNDSEITKYHNMVTQYTSSMGKANEIGVETTSFRNYYYYIDENK
ncbi:hypothetical protein D3C72_1303400 [compost metagenome]